MLTFKQFLATLPVEVKEETKVEVKPEVGPPPKTFTMEGLKKAIRKIKERRNG